MTVLVQNMIMSNLNVQDFTDPTMISNLTPEGIRAAAVIVMVIPILAVYPFLQKYFVSFIGERFNAMASRIDTLIHEVYERELSEKEAELKAIQPGLALAESLYQEIANNGLEEKGTRSYRLFEMKRC